MFIPSWKIYLWVLGSYPPATNNFPSITTAPGMNLWVCIWDTCTHSVSGDLPSGFQHVTSLLALLELLLYPPTLHTLSPNWTLAPPVTFSGFLDTNQASPVSTLYWTNKLFSTILPSPSVWPSPDLPTPRTFSTILTCNRKLLYRQTISINIYILPYHL